MIKNLIKTFKIYRFNPVKDANHIMILLKQIHQMWTYGLRRFNKIKNEKDSTLTFRRSCREGICGSCAMNIDGINTLACLSPITKDKRDKFKSITTYVCCKDLVPDMTNFYQQYKSIKPWLIQKEENKPKDNKKIFNRLKKEVSQVIWINVFMCLLFNICPSYWWNSDKYLGPAV